MPLQLVRFESTAKDTLDFILFRFMMIFGRKRQPLFQTSLMNKSLFLLIFSFLFNKTAFGQKTTNVPLLSQSQLEWQNAELVAVFHYDLHIF